MQMHSDYKIYRLNGEAAEADWVKDLELDRVSAFMQEEAKADTLKVLVLHGSLRQRSYSRLLALEFARCRYCPIPRVVNDSCFCSCITVTKL